MRHKNGTFGGHHGRTHPAEKMYPVAPRLSNWETLEYMFEFYNWRWLPGSDNAIRNSRRDAKKRHKKKQREFHKNLCREAMEGAAKCLATGPENQGDT